MDPDVIGPDSFEITHGHKKPKEKLSSFNKEKKIHNNLNFILIIKS